jgi:glycerophosphoryl diester phosphodiesterase
LRDRRPEEARVIDLARRDGRMLRIGHRGAAALAPENTVESLRLALELGCDLVEFDVHDLDGTLVMVHDRPEVGAKGLPTLDEALDFLAGTDAGVHLDLKARGAARAVADTLRMHGVVERTLISSFRSDTLKEVGAVERGVRLGLTYPGDPAGFAHQPWARPLVRASLAALKTSFPRRLQHLLSRAGASAAVVNAGVVSGEAVARCHALGVSVLVWTVDDPAWVPRLDAMGADGVITNDPRIFQG